MMAGHQGGKERSVKVRYDEGSAIRIGPKPCSGLVGFFREAGLAAVEEQSLTIRMDYANFDDYWQPLLGGQGPVGAYFARLAPDLKARIKEAVRDAYCSGSPDGPRSLTASAWAVRAKVP
jgi:hypothetical protein